MADAPEQQQEIQDEVKPKSKLPIIIIVFVILVVLIGVVAFMIVGGKSDDSFVTTTPKVDPLVIEFPEQFTGNLSPPDDQYIYSANVALEFVAKSDASETEAEDEFGFDASGPKTKLPRIKYIIDSAIRTKTRSEVTSVAGRARLETEIKNALNQYMEKAEITAVLLTIIVPP